MDIISKTPDDECSNCIITTKEKEVVVAEDLILEILSRLPSFSVFRFKFVSKSWYSLIFNPDLLFLKHHHHHQQRLLLDHDDIFFINNNMVDKKIYWREYVLVSPQNQNQNQNQNQKQLKVFLDHVLSVFIPQKFSSSCQLIDSCNGLLLYCNKNPISGGGETQYHVFNPITKQCFELPMIDRFGNNFRKGTIYWLHIVFDPSVSLSFKVLICFAPHRLMINSGIYVYSSSSSSETSSSSSWKYLTKFQPWNYSQFRTVLLDGFLYLYKSPYRLLCFNVAKDNILFLPLPPRKMEHPRVSVYGCGDLNLLYFGVLGRRLRLIQRCFNDNPHSDQLVTSPFKFDILELERERKLERKLKQKLKRKLEVGHDKPKIKKIFKWTVKHRVVIDVNYIDLAAQIIHIYYNTGGGAGKKKGEEEEALLFLNKGRNTIISYNLTSKTFGEEQKISNVDQAHDLDIFQFTPTLFPFSC